MMSGENNVKIGYDYLVAVPIQFESRACHIWRGCGTDYIDTFQPDYVIISESPPLKESVQRQRMLKYVGEQKMVLVGSLTGSVHNIVEVDMSGKYENTVAIYAKPVTGKQ